MDDLYAAIRANHEAFVQVSTAAYRLLDELGRQLGDEGLDRGAIEAYDALAALVNHEPWITGR
jgi:hypothetical protein